jgi:hypothetical protein
MRLLWSYKWREGRTGEDRLACACHALDVRRLLYQSYGLLIDSTDVGLVTKLMVA